MGDLEPIYISFIHINYYELDENEQRPFPYNQSIQIERLVVRYTVTEHLLLQDTSYIIQLTR